MDQRLLDVILARIDKLEVKIDSLLEFKWKIVGGTIIASLVLTTLFQIIIALIK